MKTLFHFAYLQAISCLFPVMIFAALALSKTVSIPFLHRYDFILLLCLAAQILMLAYTKIFGVPLYSGFMYASVASYIYQAFSRLHVKVTDWPHPFLSIGISMCIYLNFFTHHWLYDVRWWLTCLLVVVFWKTSVSFQVGPSSFRMPLVVSFFLIGFFIWIAENVTTFLGAWQYPNQQHAWSIVHLGKISSWFLLVVISIVLVIEQRKQKNVQPVWPG